jgi:hypothetical protein
MRYAQVTSTIGTAFMVQRIISALDTFSKQPNHHISPIA